MGSNKGIIFNYAIGRNDWKIGQKDSFNIDLFSIDSQIEFFQYLHKVISSLNQISNRNERIAFFKKNLYSTIESQTIKVQNAFEIQSESLSKNFNSNNQIKITASKLFWKNCSINVDKLITEKILIEISILSDINSLKKSFFNKIKFSKNINAISSIKDSLPEELKEKLYQFIIYSKDSEEVSIAASNAISILNLAEFSFTNKNLENIKIQEANLSYGNWINTNFENSDLSNVNFSFSNIYSCNFKNCKLNNFGEITIKAHKNWVTTICYSPCGQYLASGSADTSIKLWCLKTFQEIKTFIGHQQTIKCIDYSPNGNILASTAADRTIRLWDIETCSEILLLANRFRITNAVTFSPCGEYLVFEFERRNIKILNIIDNNKSKSIKIDEDEVVKGISFTSCGKYMIVGGFDISWICIWEFENLRKIRKFSSLNPLRSLSLVAYKKFTATSGSKGVKIWNLIEGSQVMSYDNYPNLVNSVALSCGNKMASCSWRDIYIHDLSSNNQTHLLQNHNDIVSTIAFSPCGKFLASGSWDKTIKIWNLKPFEIKNKEIIGQTSAAIWSSCGSFFITCEHTGAIYIWCSKTFKIIKKLKSHTSSVSSISISPCNNYLVSGGADSEVKLWDLKTGELIKSHQERLGVIFVAFANNGKHVISCLTRDWSIIRHKNFFNTSSFQNSENFTKTVNSISISNNSKYLAIASTDDYIAIFSSKTLKRVKKLYTFQPSIFVTTFSPCDNFLASGGNDKTIEIYSLETKKAIKHFQGHKENVSALAFSPCGKYIASGSWDKSVIVWDIESRTILNQLNGHIDIVSSICYSPCGKFILSGSKDKTIKIWKNCEDEEVAGKNKYNLLWSSWGGNTSIYNSQI